MNYFISLLLIITGVSLSILTISDFFNISFVREASMLFLGYSLFIWGAILATVSEDRDE